MIIYKISTGEITQGSTPLGRGYSGQPIDKNDPTKEDEPGLGPIPVGLYTIGEPHDSATHGPFVLALTPHPDNKMFGRSGFLIHGDSKEHLGLASHGCIVTPRIVRETIHRLDDPLLSVIA